MKGRSRSKELPEVLGQGRVRRPDAPLNAVQLLRERPQAATVDHVLALQRLAGNAATAQLLRTADAVPRTGITVQRQGWFGGGKKLGWLATRGIVGGMGLLRWPVNKIRDAITRLKQNKATAADEKAIEELAASLGYDELRRKPRWMQDSAEVDRITTLLNDEAIKRGLTVNF